MRFILTLASLAFVATSPACAAPAIEDDLNAGDVPLPERDPTGNRDAGGGTTNKDSGGGTTPPSDKLTVTVQLSGSGTAAVTSTPAGVTCTGATCKGTFAKGTAVTLQLAPATGSVFTGWSGKCTGTTACAPVVDADVSVGAALESLEGAWAGTYTNSRVASGCTFNNNGNLGATVTATGSTFASSETMTGLELREIPGCGLVRTTSGVAPASPLTVAGATVTGTWTFSVQGAGGTLAFPFTATVGAKKITGTWTCATCNGGFSLTKP